MFHEKVHQFLLGIKKRPMRWMCYQLATPAHDEFFVRAENYEALWHWQIQGGLIGEFRGFAHHEIVE